MTRDEAKELFRKDKDSYGKPKGVMGKIDQIYDEFEERELTKTSMEILLEDVITTWESLGEGEHSAITIGRWLLKDMSPAINNLRKELGND